MTGDSLVCLTDTQPTPDIRRGEVKNFRENFDMADFHRFFEQSSFLEELINIPTSDERFNFFIKKYEQFRPKPDTHFFLYFLNEFQKKYPKVDLSMCEHLSVSIGDDNYKKMCKAPGFEEHKVFCSGLRKDFCKTYEKAKVASAYQQPYQPSLQSRDL